MLALLAENFFKTLSAEMITNIFIWTIIIIWVLSCVWAALGKKSNFISHAPTLMTSLGILGTFIGIVIGLMYFDTTNIEGSIPALLEGLKTAFITSVFGLLAAISFNILNTLFFNGMTAKRNAKAAAQASDTTAKEEITPLDIFNSLESQREIMSATQQSMLLLNQGITGNEEGSLVGQFKMLRADQAEQAKSLRYIEQHLNVEQPESMAHQLLEKNTQLNDNFVAFTQQQNENNKTFEDKLFKALEEFAEMMSRGATEQIIEALKNVIQEFNSTLTEQFGENFKALDESVKKLVVWQEQYKDHVEVMSDQFTQSVHSLKDTREAVGGIWQECENIPKAMSDLKDVLEVNQHQIQELQRHLETFVAMRDAAVAAVPTIQIQLTDISKQMVDGSNEMKLTLEEGAEHFRNSVTTTQQSFNEMSQTVQQTAESMSDTLQDTSRDLHERSSTTIAEMDKSVRSMQEQASTSVTELSDKTKQVSENMQQLATQFDRMSESVIADVRSNVEQVSNELQKVLNQSDATFKEHMRSAADTTGDTVNTQLKLLEQATAREIETAVQTMSNLLAQITTKFVEDYQIMVRAMEQVISAANDQ
ncbi:MAG: MotA/TolQ/ExbB proton channel family protein [Pseudomonas sp.]|nr:MotA/TolQ/ExbB proton channel family protein [Thiopseudomonas sp.]MCK9533523.1 MotA/TolQ/ExbB proton channel family protein [Pseudomonas sp.]